MKPTINVTFKVSSCTFDANNGEHTMALDFTNIDEGDFEQYALRSIVIDLQSKIRGKGDFAKNFDADKPYLVSKPGTRIATGGAIGKATKLMDKLTPAQLREFLAAVEAKLAEAE